MTTIKSNNKPNGFFVFLNDHFGSLVLLLLGLFGFYYLKSEASIDRLALQETIIQLKQLKDGQATLQGHIQSQAETERIARERLGKEVMAEIRATNGNVTAVFTALGEIKTSVAKFGVLIGEKKSNGSFSTVVAQDRGKDKPALTSVSLSYDASKPTLTEALSGSQWNNNKEIFTLSFGEWRTDKDGLRSSAGLKRTVYKDDNQTQKVGEESIPIVNGDAFYSIDNVRKLSSPPKYTLITGTLHDSATGKNGGIILLDTATTKNFGITTGVSFVGKPSYMVGVSYKFGKQ